MALSIQVEPSILFCRNRLWLALDIALAPEYSWKCNCDVELTYDILIHVNEELALYLFSGEGDLKFLIDKVLAIGAMVPIVSMAKARKVASRSDYRLSKKFEGMTKHKGVTFIELDNIPKRIESNIIVAA